jgi:phospholipid transport system transporter-binding protein
METVSLLFNAGLPYVLKADMRVDFSQAEAIDSAAVGMLLAWRRAAQQKQRDLRVVALPEGILSLARLYSVDDLLPEQAV